MIAQLHRQDAWRPTAAAVLRDARGLIAVVRQNNPERNWTIPQGGIDPGESFVAALTRELGEELGLPKHAFRIVEPHLFSGFLRYSDSRASRGYNYGKWYGVAGVQLLAGVPVQLEPPGGAVPELLDIRWLTPDDAERYCIDQPCVPHATDETREKGRRVLAPAIRAMIRVGRM